MEIFKSIAKGMEELGKETIDFAKTADKKAEVELDKFQKLSPKSQAKIVAKTFLVALAVGIVSFLIHPVLTIFTLPTAATAAFFYFTHKAPSPEKENVKNIVEEVKKEAKSIWDATCGNQRAEEKSC